MSAKIINGKAIADTLRTHILAMEAKYEERGILTDTNRPMLTVVTVVTDEQEDDASAVYVRNKEREADRLGFIFDHRIITVPFNGGAFSAKAYKMFIDALKEIPKKSAIIVQLPVPGEIKTDYCNSLIDNDYISVKQDVDRFGDKYAVDLYNRNGPWGRSLPCTPLGIMNMLKFHTDAAFDFAKKCVVIGRSQIVGKPMALALLNEDKTVTICHSNTPRELLIDECQRADVIVSAVGKRHMVTKDMVKPGAIVIDVGMNRDENDKLCGDVDADVAEVAGYITPVPGGVGPMTVEMLMCNVYEYWVDHYVMKEWVDKNASKPYDDSQFSLTDKEN